MRRAVVAVGVTLVMASAVVGWRGYRERQRQAQRWYSCVVNPLGDGQVKPVKIRLRDIRTEGSAWTAHTDRGTDVLVAHGLFCMALRANAPE